MTGPQLQALFDAEQRRAAMVARVRRRAGPVTTGLAFALTVLAITGALLPAIAMAITGQPG